MFMHVFCEKCIEMVLFGVTLLPFLTETDRLALYVFIQNSGVWMLIQTELQLVVALLKCYSETKGSAKYIGKI